MVWNGKWEKTLNRKEILQVNDPTPIERGQQRKEPGEATVDTKIRRERKRLPPRIKQGSGLDTEAEQIETRLVSNRLIESFLHSLSP